MTQRLALLIAAGLTAFFLVAVVGLSMTLLQPPATPDVPGPPPPSSFVADSVSPDAGAAGPALAPEQEAIYQQALQEARLRLDEANRRLAVANEQLRLAQLPASPTPAPPAPAPTTPPAAPAPPVSPDRAALIAQTVAAGARLSKAPELVSYQGTTAYEVAFDRGLVYVNATSGHILYNGLAAPALAAPAKGAAPGRGSTDGAHESGGDD